VLYALEMLEAVESKFCLPKAMEVMRCVLLRRLSSIVTVFAL